MKQIRPPFIILALPVTSLLAWYVLATADEYPGGALGLNKGHR